MLAILDLVVVLVIVKLCRVEIDIPFKILAV